MHARIAACLIANKTKCIGEHDIGGRAFRAALAVDHFLDQELRGRDAGITKQLGIWSASRACAQR